MNASLSLPNDAFPPSLQAKDRERIRALVSSADADTDAVIRSLLQYGSTRLGVEAGYLTRIEVGPGTHTITTLGEPHPALSEGETTNLSSTYCRQVLISEGLYVVHHASEEGWRDDPVYAKYGFETYLGHKVLVDDQLLGTVCFVDPRPHEQSFSPAQEALVEAIGQHLGRVLERAPDLRAATQPCPHAALLDRTQARALFEQSPDMISVHDVEGTILAPNPRLCELTGYDEGELTQMKVWELDETLDPGEAHTLWQNMAIGDRRHIEGRYCRQDGSSFPVDVHLRHLELDGEPRFMAISRDISDRKTEERRLEAIFNHTYQFTGLMTPEGILLEVNDTALAFGGLDEADVIGKPLWKTPWAQTGADSKQKLREAIRRAATGEFVRYERPIKGREGNRIADFSIRPVTDERGKVTLLIPEARDITERKEREEALRAERDLLERIFKTSPTAITMLNADGQFVRVSDRAQEILGLTKDDVSDRTFNDPDWQITAPDGSAFPEEDLPFARVKNAGESVYNVEHAIEWPDGTRRLLSVSGAPLRDSEGSFTGAVFHLDDITERWKAKRELRKSEQRFRGVFENAGLGIALLNEEGTILEANPTLEQMMAYDPGDLRGTHFGTLTHPEDLELDDQLYNELVAGNRDRYQLEKRYLRPDGEPFWGRLTVSRRDGPDGLQIVGMVEDINQEKHQREELRLFREVVEQTYDAVVITEGDPLKKPGPRIIYTNPAFERTTGYDREEVVGKTPRILQGPDTEPWILHRIRRQLEQGHKFEGEAINYKKDGTPYINHWSIAPVRDEDGTITHWVSVQRDVTEERRMGERLLEVQDEERRRIDQEIHDEMGGLLTSLQMTVDLARLQTGPNSEVIEHLEDLEALLDELSGVARTISRRLHPSVLDDYGLSQALPSLVGEIEARHELEIDLHNEVESGERYSSLVETTAYRVVQESLWNVVRHAETSAAQVVVQTAEHQLHVHVFDAGVGFDPAAPSADDHYGLEGMRRRVERLNGRLEVDSTPGEGTRISATVPVTISSLKR
jgi:PAS domain S-box-containing protein